MPKAVTGVRAGQGREDRDRTQNRQNDRDSDQRADGLREGVTFIMSSVVGTPIILLMSTTIWNVG